MCYYLKLCWKKIESGWQAVEMHTGNVSSSVRYLYISDFWLQNKYTSFQFVILELCLGSKKESNNLSQESYNYVYLYLTFVDSAH